MNNNVEQWTKKEFLGYLMLYAANMDGNITQKEWQIIYAKVGQKTCEKILEQFAEDSEYECLQKILKYKEKHFNTADGTKEIVKEMTNVFFSDKKISNIEQHVLNMIEKL